MIKKLTRTGNSLALVIDKPMLEKLGIDETTELELSTDGEVLVISPVREMTREQRFKKALEAVNEKHADLFKRLADS
jgi:antitoxin MazE